MSVSGLLSLLVWSRNRNRFFYNIYHLILLYISEVRWVICPFSCSDVNLWSYVRWTLFLLCPVVDSGLLEVILCFTPQFLGVSPSLNLFLSLIWMAVRPFIKFLCWKPVTCNKTYLNCAFEPLQEGLWHDTGSSPVSLGERRNLPKS